MINIYDFYFYNYVLKINSGKMLNIVKMFLYIKNIFFNKNVDKFI